MDVRSCNGGASVIVTRLGVRWLWDTECLDIDDMGVLVDDRSKNLAKLAHFRASSSTSLDALSPRSPRAMEHLPKRFIETRWSCMALISESTTICLFSSIHRSFCIARYV